jgi:hypothetical protein
MTMFLCYRQDFSEDSALTPIMFRSHLNLSVAVSAVYSVATVDITERGGFPVAAVSMFVDTAYPVS